MSAELFPPIEPRRTGFLPLDDLHRLYWEELGAPDRIPIVQGRDTVCPIRTADRLARAWPGARYHIVPGGGHSGLDPAITAAQVEAGEALKALVAQPRG